MSGPFGSSQWMYNAGGGFYPTQINDSLRGNEADSPYLNRTPSSASNRRTYTISAWVKPALEVATFSILGAGSSGSAYYIFGIEGDDLYFEETSSGGALRANRKLRDPSAWYHLMAAVDSTQATAANRIKLYVNGIQETSFSSETYMSQNRESSYINNTSVHYIGHSPAQGSHYLNGYIAEVNFIDGTALDPTSFGETKSGIWIPKDTSGLTFGTNGFRLAFANSAAIGDDTSGNTNDWTANNLVASDVVPDSPTNNFAVMNILDDNYASPKFTYSEGNLKYTYGYSGTGFDRVFGTIAISPDDTNKYYFEFTGNVTNEQMQWGVVSTDSLAYSIADRDNGLSATANASQLRWVSYLSAPYLYRIDSSTTSEGTLLSTSNGNAANGAIYSLVYDADAGKFYAWFNGVEFTGQNYAAGTSLWATMDTSKTYMVMMYQGDGGVSTKSGNMTANFGQDSSFAGAKARQGNTDANGLGDFYYPVPDGALALCTANLPQGAIDPANDETPEDYFNTLLYTGNGADGRALTGVGFQPDWTWIKSRNVSRDHKITDSVRGVNKELGSHTTAAEVTRTNGLSVFGSDGFTVGSESGYNNSGDTFVAWNWKAGGTAVSNTDGSITSQVSAAPDAGFSIVTYASTTGTVGHGLTQAPEAIIMKGRNVSDQWTVGHKDLAGGSSPWNYGIPLNTTASTQTNSGFWNNTAPTSTVFSQGSWDSGYNKVAYCFHSVDGFSKVGSYVGNSSTDGTFVHTGFRPAWVLVKSTSSGTQWMIYDTNRLGYNVDNNTLTADDNVAEKTDNDVDLLSNGFKWRRSSPNFNQSTYIYLAFAEQPFKYANAR